MQISSNITQNYNNHNFSTLQNINANLKPDEKQILRQALMQVPSKDVNKILEKIKHIPVDENYLKNIIHTIESEKPVQKEGLDLYA